MITVEPSVGSLARKTIVAPALRVLNTNAPIRPLNVPVWTAP